MFSFASKKTNTSTESLVVEKTVNAAARQSLAISEGARGLMTFGLLRCLICGLARRLVLKGEASEIVSTKLTDFVNELRRSGDLVVDSANDILDMDWYHVPIHSNRSVTFGGPTMDATFDFFRDILESPADSDAFVRQCMAPCVRDMTEEERALQSNYTKTLKAYNEARDLYWGYYRKRVLNLFRDLLRKYSNTLMQLDPEFCSYALDRVEEELDPVAAAESRAAEKPLGL